MATHTKLSDNPQTQLKAEHVLYRMFVVQAAPYLTQEVCDQILFRISSPSLTQFVKEARGDVINLDDALELVGIDGVTEARNGCAQPLDDGSRLTANRDGTFTVKGGE